MTPALEHIREKVVPIIERDSIELDRVIVFGSYAKGKNTANSDLDIFVDGRLRYDPNALVDTEQRISDELSIPVDLITRNALANSVIKDKLEQAIERDGVLLYG